MIQDIVSRVARCLISKIAFFPQFEYSHILLSSAQKMFNLYQLPPVVHINQRHKHTDIALHKIYSLLLLK